MAKKRLCQPSKSKSSGPQVVLGSTSWSPPTRLDEFEEYVWSLPGLRDITIHHSKPTGTGAYFVTPFAGNILLHPLILYQTWRVSQNLPSIKRSLGPPKYPHGPQLPLRALRVPPLSAVQETVLNRFTFLGHFSWHFVVVDEGHRISSTPVMLDLRSIVHTSCRGVNNCHGPRFLVF